MNQKYGEFSKAYKRWLELPEDEKSKSIAPLPFNVGLKKESGIINNVNNLIKTVTLPSRYNLRDYFTIETKNQRRTGNCWAFSANTSVETILKRQGETLDFSERHLDYDTSLNFTDGTNEIGLNRKPTDAGRTTTAFTYYSRGSGPILEEDMPFENNENTISLAELPINSATKKIDNMIYFPNVYKKVENGELICFDSNDNIYTNEEVIQIRNQIKEHIMNHGAVSINIAHEKVQVYGGMITSNQKYGDLVDHAVTIIGWDDNFSKDNFSNKPKNNGAYIVLNSWGNEWGQNGVYYISYEDPYVEAMARGVSDVSNIEYDNLYQYDISEIYGSYRIKYGANVFMSKEDETLTEIMINVPADQTCNVYVNTRRWKFRN